VHLIQFNARVGGIFLADENSGGTPIGDITHFIAVPFDFAGRELAPGEPIKCASPAAAIERAQGLWRVLGHAGAAALVRTGYPEGRTTVLRTFGSVPEDFEV
jgi:hypothetical protein